MGEDTVLAVFAEFRQHFEVTPADDAMVVRHYANWMLHSGLCGSGAATLLDETTSLLKPSEVTDPNERIIEILRFKELRRAIRSLLADHPAVATFDSFSAWHNFLSVVLKFVVGKPLTRQKKFVGVGDHVDSLTLLATNPELEDPQLVKLLRLKPGQYAWRAHIMPRHCYAVGVLGFAERREAFRLE
jgi:hypothetical protein